ncbi:DUF2254 domain-containing protein [Falsibacillus albus]|uniref:DUF2254 domain-containing protein n=1 Tax=Falsibacillus albus TaxID=2478915 RepID=A0A3L7K470_9BACI|nr:DUF2254 domain-containing protein [Falsibacillus albus]RLQ97094.1 DUF2254 domain-containing protein [Falsibacillus albus]
MINTHFWKKARKNFWFLPTIYTIAAIILAYSTFLLDFLYVNAKSKIFPSFFMTNFSLASTIISTISSSILTMTTITFSSIMVVLTTFLSQYSPRTVQNLINDRPTQNVLAIFVSGYVYNITLLVLLKGEKQQELYISPIFAAMVAIICLFVFVYFVQHVANWVKVSHLIHNITTKTNEKIETSFLMKKESNDKKEYNEEELLARYPVKVVIKAKNEGFFQQVNIHGLTAQAQRDQCCIKMLKTSGQYVVQETPLFEVHCHSHGIRGEKYLKFITFGPDKEPIEDIDLGIRKLTEVALRAISPAINDPNTAIDCIEQIGILLSQLGRKDIPGDYILDDKNEVRLVMEQPSFHDYLYKSFFQLRYYGKNDISIMTEIIKALDHIAATNNREVKTIIWEYKDYILEGINYDALQKLDILFLDKHIRSLANSCEVSMANDQ